MLDLDPLPRLGIGQPITEIEMNLFACRQKSLLALSCLIRNNDEGLSRFLSASGTDRLIQVVQSDEPRNQRQAFDLDRLTDILLPIPSVYLQVSSHPWPENLFQIFPVCDLILLHAF